MTNNIFTVLSDEEINNINPPPEPLGDGCYYILPYARAVAQTEQLHTLQQVVEWGEQDCTNVLHPKPYHKRRRDCYKCWQEALVAKR